MAGAAGLVIGWATGGTLKHLSRLRFVALDLLLVSLLGQVVLVVIAVGSEVNEEVLYWPFLALFVGSGIWVILNIRAADAMLTRAAMAIIAVGWFTNVLVIALNMGMPLALEADQALHPEEVLEQDDLRSFRSVPLTDETILPWLSDVILVRPFQSVISIGDLIVLLGIALVIGVGMRTPATDP